MGVGLGVQPTATCKRTWVSTGGHRRDFAAVSSCRVDRWVAPHLAVRTHFDCGWWTCKVTQPVQRTPLRPWLPAVDKSAEVLRVWEIYDARLQCMVRPDALLLDESPRLDDVSLVRSWAAALALADAHQFAGRPVPLRGLAFGRGSARFRVVRLGGLKVRKSRSNVADVHEAGDVFMYRDSSIAALLDLRRRIKVVI